jgi:hypothetical protein
VGGTARRARAEAERVAKAVGPAVARIGAAEAKAAVEYQARDEAARAAAATGVPRLSKAARSAIGALHTTSGEAGGEFGRAGAWEALRADTKLAGEIDRFLDAVKARFGAKGLRAFDRGGVPEGARIAPAERAALIEVGRAVKALRGAEREAAAETRHLAVARRAGQGARMKP